MGNTRKPRKARVDSVAGMVNVAKKSQQAIQPPAHVPLEKRDVPFFESVVRQFARSEWTDHDLEIAALLARAMSDLEEDTRLLRKEGPVAHSKKGTPVVNPRKQAVQMNSAAVLSYRRSLSLHARAYKGDARDIDKRDKQARSIEAGLDNDDDLIARPESMH